MAAPPVGRRRMSPNTESGVVARNRDRLRIRKLLLRRRDRLLQRGNGQIRSLFAADVDLLPLQFEVLLQSTPSEDEQQHRRHERNSMNRTSRCRGGRTRREWTQEIMNSELRTLNHRSEFTVAPGSPAHPACSAGPAGWAGAGAARPQALPAACSRTGSRRPTREREACRRCRRMLFQCRFAIWKNFFSFHMARMKRSSSKPWNSTTSWSMRCRIASETSRKLSHSEPSTSILTTRCLPASRFLRTWFSSVSNRRPSSSRRLFRCILHGKLPSRLSSSDASD